MDQTDATTIHRPGHGDPLLARAARAAARSRLTVIARFEHRGEYARAFSTLHPGAAFVATTGDEITGVLLIRRDGQDPFDLRPVRLVCGWGPWLKHRTLEWLSSGRRCHVAAFWVQHRLRGGGIGEKLLAALCAAETDAITLLARKGQEELYRRHGFARMRPGRLWLAGRILGTTAMRRPATEPGIED